MADLDEPRRGDERTGFQSIVVALDLEDGGDRALPVARSLPTRSDVRVELLTVASPNVPDDVDAYELRRRAETYGWPDAVCTVVHDDRPVRGIAEHVAGRPGAVLVMATTAKSSLRKRLLGSVTEDVLRTVDRPVLLVGPAVTHAEVADVRAGASVTDDADANGETLERNPAAVEVLDTDECWALLARYRVGRLAVSADGRPLIFPVNYVVDGRSLVFRTAPGTKLDAARDHDVAFEIDDYDARNQEASSVIVSGRATEITDPEEVASWEDSLGLPLFPWDDVPKSHFLRITADEASGRRFHAVFAGPGRPPP